MWICQFLDPTVEAGKTYRYRIRLKAVNPNLGHKDKVAFPALAETRELTSEWNDGTEPITVPQEEHLYAEGDRYKSRESLGTVEYDATTLRLPQVVGLRPHLTAVAGSGRRLGHRRY